jgi:hypothetical protein
VAIEFIHDGKRWKADTPEEAIRLRHQLEIDTMREKQKTSDWEEFLARPWTPEVFNTFLDSIGEQQKAAVLFMAEHVGISSAELAERLKLESEISLGGVISGLSKQLKAMDLEPDNLYTVKTSWNGKKKERFFFLRESFLQAAEEAEWPKKKGGKDASSTKHSRK